MESSRIWLAGALLLTLCVQGRLLPAYFCGYDDFANAERAQFADQSNPMQMITTTHFASSKYRPLSRIVTYLCQLAENAPLAHRARNVAFHLLAVGLIFALGRLLGAGPELAGWGAGLFGVHPMTHQTISAAIFTIDMAYALMLGALCLFLVGYRDEKRPGMALAGMSVLFTAALLSYEATIIAGGCCVAYLALELWRGAQPAAGWKSFLLKLMAALFVPVTVLMAARFIFVHSRMPLTPPITIVKNMALYFGSLILPVDLLMLNSLFDFPLPSEILQNSRALALLAGSLGVLLLALLWWIRRRPQFQQSWASARWGEILWLVAGIVFCLLPFVVFSDHASETYQYLPAGFYGLALSMTLGALLGGGRAFRAMMGVLILLAVCGSLLRSERVSHCAAVAQRIVNEAGELEKSAGNQTLLLAEEPGAPPVRRIGLYGLQGLGTIDMLQEDFRAMQSALRLRTGKAELKAEVVSADELKRMCGSNPERCFWVAIDGQVKRYK
jgi:hypothetical protein